MLLVFNGHYINHDIDEDAQRTLNAEHVYMPWRHHITTGIEKGTLKDKIWCVYGSRQSDQRYILF